jgi:C4-dicarboxylate transporter, DctM subunit
MTRILTLIISLFALVGAPIFVCMAAFAILGGTTLHPEMSPAEAFSGAVGHVFEQLTGPTAATLATLPLFVFMGYLMAAAKTGERIVNAANMWLGWFPGGLAIVTVFTCAFFTTVTGASGVTIVALGGIILPALLKQGYTERFSMGLVIGTGSVGLLFPPALPLVVYGIIYGISAQGIADDAAGSAMKLSNFELGTFMTAGIFPGFLLIATVCAYSVFMAVRSKVPRNQFTTEGLGSVTLRALPEVALPFILIVPIAAGALQIPEAAAFATLYILVLEVGIFRDVKVTQLLKIAREAMTLIGALLIIIIAAGALTQYFIDALIADRLYVWMSQYISSPWSFLLVLNIFLIIVGFVLDIFSAIVVVVPLITPIAQRFGIDPYHLGIIFLLNLEIGYLHPPVGMNLLIASFRFNKPIVDIWKAALPFIGVMLIALLLVTYIPLVFPKTLKLFHLTGKAKHGQTDTPTPVPAEAIDAGIGSVKITWPDGGVWTVERCETPEIKDDALAYTECTAMFKLYPQCDKLTEELDKLDCRDKVLAGENPFEADAGVTPDAAPAK